MDVNNTDKQALRGAAFCAAVLGGTFIGSAVGAVPITMSAWSTLFLVWGGLVPTQFPGKRREPWDPNKAQHDYNMIRLNMERDRLGLDPNVPFTIDQAEIMANLYRQAELRELAREAQNLGEQVESLPKALESGRSDSGLGLG